MTSQAPIYLDYNASAPLLPEVRDYLSALLASQPQANPSSLHQAGRSTRHLIEEARQSVLALVGLDKAKGGRVVFTSGASEANNQFISAFHDKREGEDKPTLWISANAHASLAFPLQTSQALPLAVDRQGRVKLDELARRFSSPPPPLARKHMLGMGLSLVHNESGVIEDFMAVSQIVSQARSQGWAIHLHWDAVQAAGKIDLSSLPTDWNSLSLSAHKIGGPCGVGALVYKTSTPPLPLLWGGGQESRLRAGTENWLGITGFGRACEITNSLSLTLCSSIENLRNRLEEGIKACRPDAIIVGAGDSAKRVANCLYVITPHCEAMKLLVGFDLQSIMVSAGSACSSGKVSASASLLAQGYSYNEATQAIRFSLGPDTTLAMIDKVIEIYHGLTRSSLPIAGA